MIYDKGNYYIGSFKKGKKEGKGIEYRSDGTILYEGDFVENYYEGQGKYYNEDGSYYIGGWKNGERYGNGINYDKNGKVISEGFYGEDHVEEVGVANESEDDE